MSSEDTPPITLPPTRWEAVKYIIAHFQDSIGLESTAIEGHWDHLVHGDSPPPKDAPTTEVEYAILRKIPELHDLLIAMIEHGATEDQMALLAMFGITGVAEDLYAGVRNP